MKPQIDHQTIESMRLQISQYVATKYKHKIQFGIFSGMQLLPTSFWGQAEIGNKILGLYEQDIQKILKHLQTRQRHSTLINIGGADGYYAVGALINSLFDRSIVFEKSERGRESIHQHGIKNQVDHKLTIRKEINSTELNDFITENKSSISDMLFLIDIEGNEYELLTAAVLRNLANNHLIVEIHDRFIHDKYDDSPPPESIDFARAKETLAARAELTHNIEIIYESGRDLSNLSSIRNWPENTRSLLISEGRDTMGCWWHLSPRKHNHTPKN